MKEMMTGFFRNGLVAGALSSCLVSVGSAAGDQKGGECVRVYYDQSSDSNYHEGRIYAGFIQNLIGHFKRYRTIVAPVESYARGELEQCKASFYLGSYYDNPLPSEFTEDFSRTRRRVAWLGYQLWKMTPAQQSESLGISFRAVRSADWERPDSQGVPGFFRDIRYKGEVFFKWGRVLQGRVNRFEGSPEMNDVSVTDARVQVLAESVHSTSGQVTPYALRLGNRFYVADIPFSYTHEADRYLVLSDLLFDILDERPRYPGKRPAVIRLEDLNLAMPIAQVLETARTLQRRGVPIHTAIIPIFADPFNASGLELGTDQVPIAQAPEFLNLVRELKSKKAGFIWHGVTHQLDGSKNPFTGMSGDDFEFWDMLRSGPVSWDSPGAVLDRLDRGWQALKEAGLAPKIWEVPHYQASSLDYLIFARVFRWNIGRILYATFETESLPERFPKILTYDRSGLAGSAARKRLLGSLAVRNTSPTWGQFMPYEIYGDLYGQNVIPENLGNPQTPNEFVSQPRSVEDILAAARRNRVLRDVWGSFFFHPYLIDSKNRKIYQEPNQIREELVRLIDGMKEAGYEFIDLDQFVEKSVAKY